MLILVMFAIPLISLLLALVVLAMQMFWLLGRALKRPVLFLKSHSHCLTCGDMHGASFTPHKFFLVHFYQEPYCESAGTEVLHYKLEVYIVVPAAGCCEQPAK
jgi:hypothetical protein